ncbi:MAG: carbohydrate binding domain-containing protein [Victivallales bacterium]|nr:carbohydrate binding domain-containing protein [Victivallales bacterium]
MKRILLALLLMTFACVHAQQPPADESTRILAYNVEIGFNNASKLLETAEWIRSYDPEVILFQEIARQDSKGFAEMARLWGHSYAAVAKPFTDYSIALTSKHPFEMIETRTVDLHHGYVIAKIHGVYFMSIHTSPFDFKRRIHETAIYARRIKPLLDAGEKLIMMGDFNNYSPLDKERFDDRLEKMDPVKREAYIKGRGKNMNNGKYDYVSTQQLLDVGLIDVGYTWMKEHNIRYSSRIDLALLSPNLKDDVVESYVEFPKWKYFREFSDHWPNILKLKNLNFPKAPAPLPLPPEPELEVVPGAVNLVVNGSFDNGLEGWKKEIRTADLGSVEVVDGAAKITRLPKSTFGRIYQDMAVEPGKYYTLTFRRFMDKGALTKALVIFRGPDDKWRESTRFTYEFPWRPGVWQQGKYTFKTSDDVNYLRLDFRLDRNDFRLESEISYMLDDVVLRLATEKEIADVTMPPPEQRPAFQPTADWRDADDLVIRDMDVAPNTNMTLSLTVPPLDKPASIKVFFMNNNGNRIPNSLITFNLQPNKEAQSINEPILTSLAATRLRAQLVK